MTSSSSTINQLGVMTSWHSHKCLYSTKLTHMCWRLTSLSHVFPKLNSLQSVWLQLSWKSAQAPSKNKNMKTHSWKSESLRHICIKCDSHELADCWEIGIHVQYTSATYCMHTHTHHKNIDSTWAIFQRIREINSLHTQTKTKKLMWWFEMETSTCVPWYCHIFCQLLPIHHSKK